MILKYTKKTMQIFIIMIILCIIVSCGPSTRPKNKKRILKRLFRTNDLKSIKIEYFIVNEGTLGHVGFHTAQLKISASDFHQLIKSSGGINLNIPQDCDDYTLYNKYRFYGSLEISGIPLYEKQLGGVQITKLKTAYKIINYLEIPPKKGYPPRLNKGVESYIVVDTRNTETYRLFIKINS
jgi:hypothetical protein